MRITDRITRLEWHHDTGARMTADEIEAAAVRYEAELSSHGAPAGLGVGEALLAWRRIVEQTPEAWLQRVYAGMSPDDLYV